MVDTGQDNLGQVNNQSGGQIGEAGQEKTDDEKKRDLRQARARTAEGVQPSANLKGRGDTLGQMGRNLSDQQSQLADKHFSRNKLGQRLGNKEFGLQNDILNNKRDIAQNLQSINRNKDMAGRYDKIANSTQNSKRKEQAQQKKQEILDKNKALFEKNKNLNKNNKDLQNKLGKVNSQKKFAGLLAGQVFKHLSVRNGVVLALLINIGADTWGIIDAIFEVGTIGVWYIVALIIEAFIIAANGLIASLLVKRLHLPGIAAWGVTGGVALLEAVPIVGIFPFWSSLALGALMWVNNQESKERLQKMSDEADEARRQREENKQSNNEASRQQSRSNRQERQAQLES